uniref:Nucleoside deoxyribosyltransferase n=1 Tax=viral metagenome TaxID=1070528 RepID=A0A6C0EK87_9ZZZZ
MKLYIAGKWYDGKKIQNKMKELVALGHTITHDWTTSETTYTSAEFRMREDAISDINGVKNADVVIAIVDDNDYPYRGTSHEIGAALALGKPVMLYCPQPLVSAWCQTCFSRHPCITLFEKWTDIVNKLT